MYIVYSAVCSAVCSVGCCMLTSVSHPNPEIVTHVFYFLQQRLSTGGEIPCIRSAKESLFYTIQTFINDNPGESVQL